MDGQMRHLSNLEEQSTVSPRVPLLDLARENDELTGEILAAISDVVSSGKFVLGPDCERLEKEIARVCDTKYAVGCASGSDALLLALMARDIGTGDEVIVPSFTFFATASAAWRLGARPVFVDIDPTTFCIDPAKVAAAVTPRTRAIIPVHLFGQSAEMEPLCQLANDHNLLLVEDCAQSICSSYDGRPVGSIGQVGTFSFYPTKNLGGGGDAGMLTTSDEDLYTKLRLLRGHGMHPKYVHHQVGINSRLDSIQAAFIAVKLAHLSKWNQQRQDNARRYDELFEMASLDNYIGLPTALPNRGHVWNQYTIRVPDGQRDALRAHLAEASIGSEIYYPLPLHRQPCFASLGYETGSLPETERAADEVLSLPIFPALTAAEQHTVVARIADFYSANAVNAARAQAHGAVGSAVERLNRAS
jgi:dTDP-4-amino-4,6-dideoxygalactose transaminase